MQNSERAAVASSQMPAQCKSNFQIQAPVMHLPQSKQPQTVQSQGIFIPPFDKPSGQPGASSTLVNTSCPAETVVNRKSTNQVQDNQQDQRQKRINITQQQNGQNNIVKAVPPPLRILSQRELVLTKKQPTVAKVTFDDSGFKVPQDSRVPHLDRSLRKFHSQKNLKFDQMTTATQPYQNDKAEPLETSCKQSEERSPPQQNPPAAGFSKPMPPIRKQSTAQNLVAGTNILPTGVRNAFEQIRFKGSTRTLCDNFAGQKNSRAHVPVVTEVMDPSVQKLSQDEFLLNHSRSGNVNNNVQGAGGNTSKIAMFRTANPTFLLRNNSKMSLMSKYSVTHYNARNIIKQQQQHGSNEKQSECSNAGKGGNLVNLVNNQEETASNCNFSVNGLEHLQMANPLNLMNIGGLHQLSNKVPSPTSMANINPNHLTSNSASSAHHRQQQQAQISKSSQPNPLPTDLQAQDQQAAAYGGASPFKISPPSLTSNSKVVLRQLPLPPTDQKETGQAANPAPGQSQDLVDLCQSTNYLDQLQKLQKEDQSNRCDKQPMSQFAARRKFFSPDISGSNEQSLSLSDESRSKSKSREPKSGEPKESSTPLKVVNKAAAASLAGLAAKAPGIVAQAPLQSMAVNDLQKASAQAVGSTHGLGSTFGPQPYQNMERVIRPVRNELTMQSFMNQVIIVPESEKVQKVDKSLSNTNDDSKNFGGEQQAPGQEKTRQRKRKERKPWRAPTAYEIFCEQERPKLKARLPMACSRDINRELGTIWASFSKQDKRKYNKEAKGDKQTIANNLKAIEEKIGRQLKKPVCAYSMFVKDYRQSIQSENAGLSHIQIMQKLSQKWKNLSPEVKNSYEERAERDKQRYDEDQILFNQEFLQMNQKTGSPLPNQAISINKQRPVPPSKGSDQMINQILGPDLNLGNTQQTNISSQRQLLGQKRDLGQMMKGNLDQDSSQRCSSGSGTKRNNTSFD